jgi:hypothetical protein
MGNRQTKEFVALANEDTPVVSATQEEYNEWFRNRDTQHKTGYEPRSSVGFPSFSWWRKATSTKEQNYKILKI